MANSRQGSRLPVYVQVGREQAAHQLVYFKDMFGVVALERKRVRCGT